MTSADEKARAMTTSDLVGQVAHYAARAVAMRWLRPEEVEFLRAVRAEIDRRFPRRLVRRAEEPHE